MERNWLHNSTDLPEAKPPNNRLQWTVLRSATEPRRSIAREGGHRIRSTGEQMATWITHLRVAEKLELDHAGPEYQSFLVGNIAPDAGKLNEDRKTYTPSAIISHYRNLDIPKWGNDNLAFYRQYILDGRASLLGTERNFKLGYFLHLFLDDLWRFYVYHPAKLRYQREMTENPMFIWEIKKDWYGIDKKYVRDNPGWPTWTAFLDADYTEDYIDFYPAKTISDKIASIKEFYSQTIDSPRPGRYLRSEDMDQFVNLASHWIGVGIGLLEARGPGSHHSIMNLLENRYGEFQQEVGRLDEDFKKIVGEKGAR